MADYMTGTLILPTFALTLDPIAAIFYHEAEFDEQDDQPNGTTIAIQHEACYGAFPELEAALVAAGIAFDRHSDAKWDHNGEWRYFRPATSENPRCDSIVDTLQPDEPAITLTALTALAKTRRLSMKAIRTALGIPADSVAQWTHRHARRFVTHKPSTVDTGGKRNE
jgi:hypothetical protein